MLDFAVYLLILGDALTGLRLTRFFLFCRPLQILTCMDLIEPSVTHFTKYGGPHTAQPLGLNGVLMKVAMRSRDC